MLDFEFSQKRFSKKMKILWTFYHEPMKTVNLVLKQTNVIYITEYLAGLTFLRTVRGVARQQSWHYISWGSAASTSHQLEVSSSKQPHMANGSRQVTKWRVIIFFDICYAVIELRGKFKFELLKNNYLINLFSNYYKVIEIYIAE